MAKVIKIFKTLRNNWKKSTFVAVLGFYGIQYGRNWHSDYMLMRDYSKEALVHGLRPLPTGCKNKHITVFLNPTAANRKSKTKLEKYSEPLLHLAGFLVNIVRTERIDEARDLAKIIEKTNIIVSAGGDGTLFETVTGLLRRDDAEEALRKYPVAVIPLGFHNQFAKRLFHNKSDQADAKFIAESTMAIVKHKIKPQDVMQVTIAEDKAETETEGEENFENVTKPKRPFYSLAGIAIGQFRDAQKIKDDMPSIFPTYFATFLSLYRTPEQYFKAEIRYSEACEGCMKCSKPIENIKAASTTVSALKSNQPSIWSRIFSGVQPVHAQEMPKIDNDSPYVNPQCGNWTSFCVDTSEFNIRACGDGKLKIEVNKKLDRTDFMIEGLKRLRNGEISYSQTIECQEAEIIPIDGQTFMSIDNEEFEMKSIKLKCLKNKVYFFVPS